MYRSSLAIVVIGVHCSPQAIVADGERITPGVVVETQSPSELLHTDCALSIHHWSVYHSS